MTITDSLALAVPFIPAGFLLGCIPMLFGIGVQVITNIFKKI